MRQRTHFVDHFLRTAKLYVSLGILTMIGEAEKLGDSTKARTFNLPLDRTCCARRPDGSMIATWVCRGVCYSYQMSHGRKGVIDRARKNWYIAQRPDFVELMVGAIYYYAPLDFRIHDFGDLHSSEYVFAWCQIVRLCPRVHFLVYTRAWRIPELVPPLRELAAEPNVNLLTSHDREAAGPAAIPNTEEAWLLDSDATIPLRPVRVCFRASREAKTLPMKTAGGSLVCPHESGRQLKNVTCHTCRHCFFKERQA